MKLLALDTSTEIMSLAVQHGDQVWAHTGASGAQASLCMLADIEQLMQRAGLTYAELDAIVFGRGPGSFTGLRTACAVAQGLALGAGLRVLPVDTLLCVAQEAQWRAAAAGLDARRVLAVLDARMGEVYAHCFAADDASPPIAQGYALKKPAELLQGWRETPTLLAGNIRPLWDAQLTAAARDLPLLDCWPSARALLALAPGRIAAGDAVDAQDALPLYVRDKVALTTLERELKK